LIKKRRNEIQFRMIPGDITERTFEKHG